MADVDAPAAIRSAADGDRVRSLDGLRGLAVAGVVAFHLGHLDGGYLGVDLFFVLSGYLITGLLLRGDGPGAAGAIARFWRRRARRIVPAQLIVLLGAALFALLAADEATGAALRGDALAAVLGVANWHDVASADGYWDLFAAPAPLAHLWSLSIELQLYLVWPVLARVVWRRAGAAGVLRVALGLAAVSAGWAMTLHSWGASADRVYLGTDTRAAALLLGAALAAAEAARRERGVDPHVPIPTVSALVAVGAVAWLWFDLDGADPTLYQGGLLLHSAASAVLVAVAVGPARRWLHAVLTLRPLVGLGMISYGVYLWHWLVIVWADEARTGLDGAGLLVVRLALTLVASLVSYVLVEQPLRRGLLADRWLPAAVPMASLVVLLAIGLATAGASSPSSGPPVRPSAADDDRPRVLVVGDSLALNLATEMFRLDGDREVRVAAASYPGCTIVAAGTPQRVRSGEEPARGCGPYDDAAGALAASAATVQPAVVVVSFGLPGVQTTQDGGAWGHDCLDDGGVRRVAQVEALVAAAPPGATVLLLTTPMPGTGRAGGLVGPANGLDVPELQRRIDCHDGVLVEVASAAGAAGDRVEVVDLAARVCEQRPCPAGDDELRPDGVHLADEGLTSTASWLLDEVEARLG